MAASNQSIKNIDFCKSVESYDSWTKHETYDSAIQQYLRECNYSRADFNCYICQSLKCLTYYDRGNDCIIFDNQLSRVYMRFNAFYIDNKIKESDFFESIVYLGMLHQTVIEQLPYFVSAAYDLYNQTSKPYRDVQFWNDFDFSKIILITEVQNKILFGHEIYHKFLYHNPEQRDKDTELLYQIAEKFLNGFDVHSLEDQLLEECLCDWFAVKTLLNEIDRDDSKEDIIVSHVMLLMNIFFFELTKISATSITHKNDDHNIKMEKETSNYIGRFTCFIGCLMAYFSGKNQKEFCSKILTVIIDIQSVSESVISNFPKWHEKFHETVMEKNADHHGNFIRYYLNLKSDFSAKNAVTDFTNLVKDYLLNSFDIFDCIEQ